MVFRGEVELAKHLCLANLGLGQASFTSDSATTSNSGMESPISVTTGPAGSILVADFDADRITRYNPINVAPVLTLAGATRRVSR